MKEFSKMGDSFGRRTSPEDIKTTPCFNNEKKNGNKISPHQYNKTIPNHSNFFNKNVNNSINNNSNKSLNDSTSNGEMRINDFNHRNSRTRGISIPYKNNMYSTEKFHNVTQSYPVRYNNKYQSNFQTISPSPSSSSSSSSSPSSSPPRGGGSPKGSPYAGAKFGDAPAPRVLPLPPKHWINSVIQQTALTHPYNEIVTNQIKLMLQMN